jgi:hypothetical protein
MSGAVRKVRELSKKLQALVEDIFEEELESASRLVKGHRLVEVPGKEDRAPTVHEPMRPSDPRGLVDYILAPCKRECVIFKQQIHI